MCRAFCAVLIWCGVLLLSTAASGQPPVAAQNFAAQGKAMGAQGKAMGLNMAAQGKAMGLKMAAQGKAMGVQGFGLGQKMAAQGKAMGKGGDPEDVRERLLEQRMELLERLREQQKR